MATELSRKTVVLVIDDDQFYRKVLKDALDADGFKSYTASNGEDGFRLYKRIMPDVVILDRIMPVSGGTRFIMAVRDEPNGRDALLVVYSSTLRKREEQYLRQEEAFIRGFKAVIERPKSIPPQELVRELRDLVSKGP